MLRLDLNLFCFSKVTREQLVRNVIRALRKLENLNMRPDIETKFHYTVCEQFLLTIYYAGIHNVHYTDAEKLEIGPLFHRIRGYISFLVGSCEYGFYTTAITYSKLERSGLEFLMNDYSDFPAEKEGTKTLKEDFEEIKEFDDVEGWDILFKEYTPDDCYFPESAPPDPRVPRSHFWWFTDLD